LPFGFRQTIFIMVFSPLTVVPCIPHKHDLERG
jgi:hypothetical protein